MHANVHWILVRKQCFTIILVLWAHIVKRFTINLQVWGEFNHSFLGHLKKNYDIITGTAIIQSKRLLECH